VKRGFNLLFLTGKKKIINMVILRSKITLKALSLMAENMFGNLVKAVVDVERCLIAVDAELHSDEESFLLEDGSKQEDLWGINIYPGIDRDSEAFIEFDSMINLRPSQKNFSRGVDDPVLRQRIVSIVNEWVA
jgi:hypothetical protein